MRGLSTFGLAMLVVAPGLGTTLALYTPGELGLAGRISLTFGIGFAVTAGVGWVLAVLHVLYAATYFVVLGVATAAVWYVAVRRASLGQHARAILSELRADPWSLVPALLILAAFAFIRLDRLGGFPVLAGVRYWVDGVEVADAHHVPALSLHYGALYPTAISKVYLNTFDAGVSYALGRLPVPAVPALLWIGSVGLAATLWGFGREIGLRYTAILVPVLLLANRVILRPELTEDLARYKAETFGRMVAFAALVPAIRAIRDRTGRRDVWVAGLLLGAAAGTHLVPAVVAGALAGWYWLARLLLDRAIRPLVQRAVVLTLVAGLTAALILVLPGGDIGFQAAGRSGGAQPTNASFDEGRYLYSGQIVAIRHDLPGGWYVSPGEVFRDYFAETLDLHGSGARSRTSRFGVLIAILASLAAAGMMVWFPRDLRPIGFVACGLGATLITFGLAFSYRYDLFITGTFGIRRMFDYGVIPLVLLVLALVEAGLHLLRNVRSARGRLPVSPALAVVLVVAIAAVMLPSIRLRGPSSPRSPGAEVVDWVRENTPCDARILANQRTVGLFRSWTGRVAVLEGMGPFLRPKMLAQVVPQLLSARRFFADPPGNASFLIDQGVDYVLVVHFRIGYFQPLHRANATVLASVPFLEHVEHSKAFDVYRVVGLPVTTGFTSPVGQPGYVCEQAPL